MEITLKQALQLAFKSQKQGNYNRAEKLFKAVIKSQPNNPEANYGLGLLTIDGKHTEAAFHYFKKALEINKNDGRYWVSCIETLIKLNRFSDAELLLSQGKKIGLTGRKIDNLEQDLSAFNIDSKLDAARALYKSNQLVLALSITVQLLVENPNLDRGYNILGSINAARQNYLNAVSDYKKALQIQPDIKLYSKNLGNTLIGLKNYSAAIKHLKNADDPISRSQALECLYMMDQFSELIEELKTVSKSDTRNIRLASFSAFAADQLKFPDPFPFCKNPLEFIKFSNLGNYEKNIGHFVEQIIEAVDKKQFMYDPQNNTTKFGTRTNPDLFPSKQASLQKLENIIKTEIASYRSYYSNNNGLTQEWPENFDLTGWFVRLKKNGHQTGHIHPNGWLSGVIYLKPITNAVNKEGAIEFSLNGYDWPIMTHPLKNLVYQPKPGDIVLFPSSLFHRTIPVKRNLERCIIAFDMNPKNI